MAYIGTRQRYKFTFTGLGEVSDSKKEDLIKKIRLLGGSYLEIGDDDQWDESITHVMEIVARTGFTKKIMCALASGKWIVNEQFLTQSYSRASWQDEEKFLMKPSSLCMYFRSPEGRKVIRRAFGNMKAAVIMEDKDKRLTYIEVLRAAGAFVHKVSNFVALRKCKLKENQLTHVFLDPNERAKKKDEVIGFYRHSMRNGMKDVLYSNYKFIHDKLKFSGVIELYYNFLSDEDVRQLSTRRALLNPIGKGKKRKIPEDPKANSKRLNQGERTAASKSTTDAEVITLDDSDEDDVGSQATSTRQSSTRTGSQPQKKSPTLVTIDSDEEDIEELIRYVKIATKLKREYIDLEPDIKPVIKGEFGDVIVDSKGTSMWKKSEADRRNEEDSTEEIILDTDSDSRDSDSSIEEAADGRVDQEERFESSLAPDTPASPQPKLDFVPIILPFRKPIQSVADPQPTEPAPKFSADVSAQKIAEYDSQELSADKMADPEEKLSCSIGDVNSDLDDLVDEDGSPKLSQTIPKPIDHEDTTASASPVFQMDYSLSVAESERLSIGSPLVADHASIVPEAPTVASESDSSSPPAPLTKLSETREEFDDAGEVRGTSDRVGNEEKMTPPRREDEEDAVKAQSILKSPRKVPCEMEKEVSTKPSKSLSIVSGVERLKLLNNPYSHLEGITEMLEERFERSDENLCVGNTVLRNPVYDKSSRQRKSDKQMKVKSCIANDISEIADLSESQGNFMKIGRIYDTFLEMKINYCSPEVQPTKRDINISFRFLAHGRWDGLLMRFIYRFLHTNLMFNLGQWDQCWHQYSLRVLSAMNLATIAYKSVMNFENYSDVQVVRKFWSFVLGQVHQHLVSEKSSESQVGPVLLLFLLVKISQYDLELYLKHPRLKLNKINPIIFYMCGGLGDNLTKNFEFKVEDNEALRDLLQVYVASIQQAATSITATTRRFIGCLALLVSRIDFKGKAKCSHALPASSNTMALSKSVSKALDKLADKTQLIAELSLLQPNWFSAQVTWHLLQKGNNEKQKRWKSSELEKIRISNLVDRLDKLFLTDNKKNDSGAKNVDERSASDEQMEVESAVPEVPSLAKANGSHITLPTTSAELAGNEDASTLANGSSSKDGDEGSAPSATLTVRLLENLMHKLVSFTQVHAIYRCEMFLSDEDAKGAKEKGQLLDDDAFAFAGLTKARRLTAAPAAVQTVKKSKFAVESIEMPIQRIREQVEELAACHRRDGEKDVVSLNQQLFTAVGSLLFEIKDWNEF